MRFTYHKLDNDIIQIEVLKAEWIRDYLLEIRFTDGKIQKVDFGQFLKNSKHPEIQKYLEPELFKKFEIRDGNLDWNNFDLIFPVSDLYAGEITA